MMIGYVSFAAAGIAASLVLHRVFVRVSAEAARFSAFLGVILKSSRSGACSAKAVKSVWLLLGVLPRVAFGYAPPPSLCEWDASCQSVPGLGYPTLRFFFSAAAAFIVIAIVIMLWKCCSLCSGSCKERKKESLSKLVEEKQFPSFSLQVASWFTAAVMANCKCVWAAPFRNVVANHSVLEEGMFIVGSVTDQCQKTSLCFHLAVFAVISILSSPGCELLCGHVLGLRQPQFAAACTRRTDMWRVSWRRGCSYGPDCCRTKEIPLLLDEVIDVPCCAGRAASQVVV